MHEPPSTKSVKRSPESGERDYRQRVRTRLTPARVVVQETDLSIYAEGDVTAISKEAVIRQRGFIENYIRRHPDFVASLEPWPEDDLAPRIVRQMIDAGQKARVGPMASVAGAVAEAVGCAIRSETGQLIIENGGDIYADTTRDIRVAIYAAQSPLSLKLGVLVSAERMPMAICTSSGTIGHSLSHGRADAACVISRNCALADAAATAIGNRVATAADINAAIQWGKDIDGVLGIVVILGERIGVWGRLELVPLKIS
jgi:hypothetical protein